MQQEYSLEILYAAQIEIEEIGEVYLELVGPNSARDITNRIYDALENLCEFPLMGTLLDDRVLRELGYRKLICGVYLCFYRVMGNIVYVHHVVDGRTEYKRLFGSMISE